MNKTKEDTVARQKAVARQELRRCNAAVPHRNGRAKEEAKRRKHRDRSKYEAY
jgi:hypothetical protein